MKHKHQENIHHLIWQSLSNEYNVHTDKNKLKMDIEKHNALHRLYGMLLTPKEQLKESYHIYESVLSSTAKALFQELIKLPDENFYISDVLKWKKKQQALKN